MYGLIGKFTASEGQREALVDILLEGMQDLPGCHSYIVARDPGDDVTLWITEVWESAEHHKAALELDSVREAIGKGRPMIAGMQRVAETAPAGGHGLVMEPL
ncbi:putative quinol monooxygenase [Maricaulis sp. CAU 1757]